MGLRRRFMALALARAVSCSTLTCEARRYRLRGGANISASHHAPQVTSSMAGREATAASITCSFITTSSTTIDTGPYYCCRNRRHSRPGTSHSMALYGGRGRWTTSDDDDAFLGKDRRISTPFVLGTTPLSLSLPRRGRVQQGGMARGIVTMAQPRKKMPERSVNVFCAKCKTQLYRYKKGGKGSLVKCYKERIVQDYTEGSLQCPGCQQEFARPAMVHGKPAFKMIGGKVFQKK